MGARVRLLSILLAACCALVLLPRHVAAFSLLGPDTTADGETSPEAHFQAFDKEFRWSIDSLTYSIDESFTDAYGEAGVAALRSALSSWDNAFGSTSSATSTSIFTSSGQFDIESIALHELGHAMGLGHTDDAPPGKNFDASGQAVASTGSEVLSATLAAGELRRGLTSDDLAGFNYLYDPSNVNVANGVNLGPGVGDLSFLEWAGAAAQGVGQGANIDFFAVSGDHAAFTSTDDLAVAQVSFVYVNGTDGPGIINSVQQLSTVTGGVDIYFNTSQSLGVVCDGAFALCGDTGGTETVPEPGAFALFGIGLASLLAGRHWNRAGRSS